MRGGGPFPKFQPFPCAADLWPHPLMSALGHTYTECVPIQKYVPEIAGKAWLPPKSARFEVTWPRQNHCRRGRNGGGQWGNLEVGVGSPAQCGQQRRNGGKPPDQEG